MLSCSYTNGNLQHPRPRRPRHPVYHRPLAPQHPRLARPNPRHDQMVSHQRPSHPQRNHHPLGRPHGHAGMYNMGEKPPLFIPSPCTPGEGQGEGLSAPPSPRYSGGAIKEGAPNDAWPATRHSIPPRTHPHRHPGRPRRRDEKIPRKRRRSRRHHRLHGAEPSDLRSPNGDRNPGRPRPRPKKTLRAATPPKNSRIGSRFRQQNLVIRPIRLRLFSANLDGKILRI